MESELVSGPTLATVLAWAAVLVILALLFVVVLRDRDVSKTELVVTLLGTLAIAMAGATTALLSTIPIGSVDVEAVRFLLIVMRGIATALFLGLLLRRLGWTPPGLRRFL